MPILNYTTKIDPSKTAGEIQEILMKLGAQSVLIEYENRAPAAISFQIDYQDHLINFRLPSRWQGVHRTLKADRQVEPRYKTEEQARRVSWRIIKDWIEAQCAIIQAGSTELSEVFLPYMVNPHTGRTLFQEFESDRLLISGKGE